MANPADWRTPIRGPCHTRRMEVSQDMNDETAEPLPEGLTLVYAKNRPPVTRTVHLARDGEQKALCGVHRGEAHGALAYAGLHSQEVVCLGCAKVLDRAQRFPRGPETDPLHEWKASILLRADGIAEVSLNGFSELLNSLIKETPGRRWDGDARVWLVPAAWLPELRDRLAGAGVEVRTTEQRAVLCPRCRQELALAEQPDGG